jgi:hypothetical protein
MTGIRRGVLLIALTAAVILGASIPASAGYTDQVAVNTSVSTLNVAAPSWVFINGNCQGWWYDVTVTWPASSTTRGVTGYVVTAYLNDGSTYVMGQTDPYARFVSMSVDSDYLNYQPRVTVTTLTNYGWTAETSRSAVLSC